MRWVAGALRVRAGEGRLVGLQLGLMFVASVGAAAGQTGVETMFLTRYGVGFLPYLYIALGLAMFATSLGVTALLARIPRDRFFLGLPVVMASLLVGERMLLATDPHWFYPALWVLMTLFLNMQFQFSWGIAGAVVDPRQAKRLFPLFGAGAILGAVAGGLLTPQLLGVLRIEDLLLVWAAGLMGSLLIARVQLGVRERAREGARGRQAAVQAAATARQGVERPSPGAGPGLAARKPPRPSLIADTLAGYQLVRASPMLTWMSVAALLFALLAYLVWFSFSKAAAGAYADPAELAAFLARFQAANTATALVLSLFVANRLFARFGVGPMVLVWPSLHVVGFGALLAWAGFPLMAAFRLGQLAWMQGITNAAWQAIFSVVPPAEREKVRAFNSGVPSQAGTIAAGLLLILAEGALAPTHFYAVGLVLAVMGVYAVLRLARAYRARLIDAVRSGWPHVFHDHADPFQDLAGDATALQALELGLADPSPGVRRVAAEILGQLAATSTADHARLRAALMPALRDADAHVRAEAVRALAATAVRADSPGVQGAEPLGGSRAEPWRREQGGRAGASAGGLGTSGGRPGRGDGPEGNAAPESSTDAVAVTTAIAALVGDDAATVRRAAVEALGATGADLTALRACLDDPDPDVRATAAGALLRRAEDERAAETLLTMLADPDAAVRAGAIRPLAGWSDVQAHHALLRALADPAPRVRRRAARALGERADDELTAHALMRALADRDGSVRRAAAGAIELAGEVGRRRALAALADPTIVDGAIQALAGLPLAGAESAIEIYASGAVERALRHHQLAGAFETGSPLADALLACARREGARAMKTLGLLGERATVGLALEELAAGSPAQRLSALEALDALAPGFAKPVLRVWDAPEPRPPADYAELRDLFAAADPWLRACAAAAARDHLGAGHASADRARPRRSVAPGGGSSKRDAAAGADAGGLASALDTLASSDPEPLVREAARLSLQEPAVQTLATLSTFDRILLLRRVALFADLDAEELKEVAALAVERQYADGEALAQQGEACAEMFVVVEGEVRAFVSQDGRTLEVARRGAGDYVGEMAIIAHQPHAATLVAAGPVRVLAIDQPSFEEILRERPETCLALLRQLCQRLQPEVGKPTGSPLAAALLA